MKKSVISMGLALIMAMAFSSCNKTEEGKSENAMFRASTANVTSSDKTFVGQQGLDTIVMWNAGDAIKVFTRTASPFSVEASVLTTDEDAKSVVPFYGNVRESDVYYAFYPACKISDLEAGNKIHVTLPETQAYTEGGFAGNTYPMWAFSTEKYFNFQSTCAILGIQLKGNAKVGSIVLSSKSEDQPLAGTVEIDAAAFDPAKPRYTFTEEKKSVTLGCGEQGEQLTENDTTIFYFVIPANTYHGIEVVVNDLQGNKLGGKETSNPLNMAAETIYKMNPFTVNADTPEPGVEGYFTVNSNGDQVVFAPGNLYYLPNATTKWQFAPRHYGRMVVEDQFTDNPNIDRDLFGWGTSGYHDSSDELNHFYNPWNITSDWDWPGQPYNVHGYGPTATPQGGTDIGGNGVLVKRNYDWGYYNDIYNPSTKQTDEAGTWRVLTGGPNGEWSYIFNYRSTECTGLNMDRDARYVFATLDGVGENGTNVEGVIIFPDVYNHPQGVAIPQYINYDNDNFTGNLFSMNHYSSADWDKMDLAGAVFLPSEIRRYNGGGNVEHRPGIWYWSATHLHEGEDKGTAAFIIYCEYFEWWNGVYVNKTSIDLKNMSDRRCDGLHVRLAKDVK